MIRFPRRPPVPARSLLLPLLVLAAAVLSGCEAGAEARSPGDALTAPPWHLEPELRIGAVDDPDFAFGPVRSLAVAEDGTIVSLHAGEAALRRWTPDGRPAGTVGREGEGPGEFRSPGGAGFFGDTLWVWDYSNFRATFFGPDGALLGTLTPTVDLGGGAERRWQAPPRPEMPLRGGGFVGRSPAFSNGIATGDITSAPVVRMDGEGATLDTAWVQPWERHDVLALLRPGGQGGTYSSQPFGDRPQVVIDPSHRAVFVAEQRDHPGEGPAAVTVTRIGLGGDTAWHRAIPYEAVPLPGARVDSAADVVAGRLHEWLSQRDPGLSLAKMQSDVRAATYRPEHEPPLSGMLVGRDGRIWLQRFGEPEPGAADWWVLDAEGAPAGRVRTPAGLRLLAADDEHLWGVETDDLDVPYIVRYRIRLDNP